MLTHPSLTKPTTSLACCCLFVQKSGLLSQLASVCETGLLSQLQYLSQLASIFETGLFHR